MPVQQQLMMRLPSLHGAWRHRDDLDLARRIRDGETASLCALLTSVFGQPWDRELADRELLAAPAVEATYVVVRDGRVIACASARRPPDDWPGHGYVHWVASAPDYRGQGLGELVTRRVLWHFADRGLHGAVLETDDERLPAIRTYLRLGFVPQYRTDADPVRWSQVFEQLLRRTTGLTTPSPPDASASGTATKPANAGRSGT